MDFAELLDLESSHKKSSRVRAWYLYEKLKSLEKKQQFAAKKAKEPERLPNKELVERRTRRQLSRHFLWDDTDLFRDDSKETINFQIYDVPCCDIDKSEDMNTPVSWQSATPKRNTSKQEFPSDLNSTIEVLGDVFFDSPFEPCERFIDKPTNSSVCRRRVTFSDESFVNGTSSDYGSGTMKSRNAKQVKQLEKLINEDFNTGLLGDLERNEVVYEANNADNQNKQNDEVNKVKDTLVRSCLQCNLLFSDNNLTNLESKVW